MLWDFLYWDIENEWKIEMRNTWETGGGGAKWSETREGRPKLVKIWEQRVGARMVYTIY
jgi:hypothetical protein